MAADNQLSQQSAEQQFNYATDRPLIDETTGKPLKPTEMRYLINQLRNDYRGCAINKMTGDMWGKVWEILNRWGIYEDLPKDVFKQ